MAEYKTIKGFKTQSYATDPTPATAAWSSGGTMGKARYYVQGTGTQSAAIIMGGNAGSKTNAETYDGTTWTEVNDILTGRRQTASAGTQTTAMIIGGQIVSPNASHLISLVLLAIKKGMKVGALASLACDQSGEIQGIKEAASACNKVLGKQRKAL